MCTLLAFDSDPLVHVDVKSCAAALCSVCFHPKFPAKLAFVPYPLALKFQINPFGSAKRHVGQRQILQPHLRRRLHGGSGPKFGWHFIGATTTWAFFLHLLQFFLSARRIIAHINWFKKEMLDKHVLTDVKSGFSRGSIFCFKWSNDLHKYT